MPLFSIKQNKLQLSLQTNFGLEKELQGLIENNLETVFNCKFIATEFSTGIEHAGRIDTLALSEDGNPVIIEYKKIESSELLNQSLYYLAWIKDHKGDFEVAAKRALGNSVEIDWSDIRVICMAPGYKKFDLHAVKMMGANIELWEYSLFENGSFHLEEVFRKSTGRTYSRHASSVDSNSSNPSPATQEIPLYTFDQYFENAEPLVKEIVNELRDQILAISDSIEESPKKFYIAYKVAQNFVCIQKTRDKVTLYLKLDPHAVSPMPSNGRDVSDVGHYGTGDFELVLRSKDQIQEAMKYIRKSLENVGG